jgi:hypothetical protein
VTKAQVDAAAVNAWLAERDEAAPPSLSPRLAGAVTAASSGETLGEVLCDASERLLAKLLADGCDDRDAAPDLLTADALLTYAFEAAAESEAETTRTIETHAAQAMSRVAALGVET